MVGCLTDHYSSRSIAAGVDVSGPNQWSKSFFELFFKHSRKPSRGTSQNGRLDTRGSPRDTERHRRRTRSAHIIKLYLEVERLAAAGVVGRRPDVCLLLWYNVMYRWRHLSCRTRSRGSKNTHSLLSGRFIKPQTPPPSRHASFVFTLRGGRGERIIIYNMWRAKKLNPKTIEEWKKCARQSTWVNFGWPSIFKAKAG